VKKINGNYPILIPCLTDAAGSNEAETGGPPQEYYGVKVDWRKLDAVFTNSSPEVQASVTLLLQDFRYAQFSKALADLDKLSNDPSLTPPQKKLVTDLTEQTKQVIAKAPPEPAR